MTSLTQEEVDACGIAFNKFDADGSGTIDRQELRAVLEAMGQTPTEEELFQMIAECDKDCSGDIDFHEFLDMIERQSQKSEMWNDHEDALDAFVACGGEADGSGHVIRETLVKILHSIGLESFPIDKLIDKVDVDRSGLIDFHEFKLMLSTNDLALDTTPRVSPRELATAATTEQQ